MDTTGQLASSIPDQRSTRLRDLAPRAAVPSDATLSGFGSHI